MKKIIALCLIITTISCVFLPQTVYGEESQDSSNTIKNQASLIKLDDPEGFQKDLENGETKVNAQDSPNQNPRPFDVKKSTLNSTIKIVVIFVNIIPTIVRLLLTLVSEEYNHPIDTSDPEQIENLNSIQTNIVKITGIPRMFTIQNILFNDVRMLNANFFDNAKYAQSGLAQGLKENVEKWFYLMRNFAIAGMLILLLYTGLRMAISVTISDKAKYKEMLINIFTGMLMLFFMHYFMAFINFSGEVLLELCKSISDGFNGAVVKDLENDLLIQSIGDGETGFNILIPSIIYWMITFFQIKFFYIYLKRFFSIIILMVISPLILLQYIFDKVGDNKGNAFKIWLEEYSVNILIQPLHAFLYTVFMSIAANIVTVFPLLAVIFLGALSEGEKLLRKVFKVKDVESLSSMEKSVKAKDTFSKIGG